MEVPKRIFQDWKLNKEHGDVKAIREESVKAGTPISEITISNVLRTGKGSKNTISFINKFYKSIKPSLKKTKELTFIAELEAE